MGARVYIPGLGRFLQVDPIEGGTANAYVYALDPVNQSDYSGRDLFGFVRAVVTVVSYVVTNYSSNKYVAAATKAVAPLVNAFNSIVSAAPAVMATAQSYSSIKPVATIQPKTTFDFGKLKPELRIGAPPRSQSSQETGQLGVSICLVVICGNAGIAYDGNGLPHFSIGYGIALEAGVAITAGGSPGKVGTGWYGQFSCSAGPYYGSFNVNRDSGQGSGEGGFNVLPAQLGCNAGGGYTF